HGQLAGRRGQITGRGHSSDGCDHSSPLLEVKDVSKGFPGVQALQGVSLRLYAGEVLAVVGENGAGKSTLMKIMAGVYQPDAGTILFEGKPVRLGSVSEALRHGINL